MMICAFGQFKLRPEKAGWKRARNGAFPAMDEDGLSNPLPMKGNESGIYTDAQDGFGPIPLVQLGVI